MNDPDFNELANKALGGKLSPEERAALATRQEYSEDLELGRLIAEIPPPPPVSSNFTAQVMNAVREGERTRQRERQGGWLRWIRAPRLGRIAAMASLIAILGIAVIQNRRAAERAQLAQTYQAVADVAKKAAPDGNEAEVVARVLMDFEAIRSLPETESAIDTTLLSALTE